MDLPITMHAPPFICPIGAHKILSYIRVIQMNNSCCFVGGECKPRLGLASATAAIHLDDPNVA